MHFLYNIDLMFTSTNKPVYAGVSPYANVSGLNKNLGNFTSVGPGLNNANFRRG